MVVDAFEFASNAEGVVDVDLFKAINDSMSDGAGVAGHIGTTDEFVLRVGENDDGHLLEPFVVVCA